MLTNDLDSNNNLNDQFIDFNKISNSAFKINLIQSLSQSSPFIKPFENNLNNFSQDKKFSSTNIKNIFEKPLPYISQFIYEKENYLKKIPKCLPVKKSKKRRMNLSWSVDEETSFLSVFLIILRFDKKIKLSFLHSLIANKSYAEIYRHYYRNKIVVCEFSKIFFSYFDCEFINNISIFEYTIEDLFDVFKNNILDKNFIQFFNSNIDNLNVVEYFKNIYSYTTLEATQIIDKESGKIVCLLDESNCKGNNLGEQEREAERGDQNHNSECNMIDNFNLPGSNEEYLNNYQREYNRNSNSICLKYYCDSRQTKFNSYNSNNRFKNSYQSHKSNNSQILKSKNLKIKVNNELYEKLLSFSLDRSSKDNLIIDEKLFLDYIVSQFNA